VLATGAFPWWGIAMAWIYAFIDLTVCSPLLRPLGYLALIVAPILFLAGRGCAIFWWFAQLYRDASLVAIIEDRKKGMSEVVLRGVLDTWLGSIVGADPDAGKLRVEILGNVERWDLVSPSRTASWRSCGGW